jgi:hypothetical protein
MISPPLSPEVSKQKLLPKINELNGGDDKSNKSKSVLINRETVLFSDRQNKKLSAANESDIEICVQTMDHSIDSTSDRRKTPNNQSQDNPSITDTEENRDTYRESMLKIKSQKSTLSVISVSDA